MRYLHVVLICFLLAGCGSSVRQPTQPTPAPTDTPSPTQTPDLTATNRAIRSATQTVQSANARVRLTEFAIPTSTAVAKAGLMLEEIQAAANTVDTFDLSKARLVYGPTDDSLTHALYDIVIVDDPRLLVKNFVVNIKFINPYDTSTTGKWDYGILFRNRYGNNQYRLIILSNQSWSLYNAETDQYIYSSNDKNIKSKAGEENVLWLIVIDAKAYLFINGVYARTLDVSTRLINGDVSPATGLFYGNLKDRRITEYKDFTVWDLP